MKSRLVYRETITPSESEAMFQLLDAHFEGVTREVFDADLAKKNWVVLVEDGHRLAGFSTILAWQMPRAGELLTLVYSGDTIVAPWAWGSMAFPRAWITAVYSLAERLMGDRLIWLLLTSGYRTYRLLPVFWETYFPRAGIKTPTEWQSLRDELAGQLFGSRYDLESGIVRLEHPQPLRGVLGFVSPQRLADPHVQFFIESNPGHRQGDELVCIADLSVKNLTRAGRRIVFGPAA